MNRCARIAAATILMLTPGLPLFSAEYTWTGAVSSAWAVAGNWIVLGIPATTAPLSTDTIVYPTGATNALVPAADIVAAGLTVKANATLDVGSYNIDVSGPLQIETFGTLRKTGMLSIRCGSLDAAENLLYDTVQATNLVIRSVGAINARSINISGAIAAVNNTGIIRLYGQSGSITIGTVDGLIGITAGDSSIFVFSSNLVVNAPVGAAGKDITLAADSLAVNAAITSIGGSLTLRQATTGRLIAIGESGAQFDLTAAEIANLSDGFKNITIGSSDASGSGTVVVAANTVFRDPVSVRSKETITVNGLSTDRDNADIIVQAALSITVNGPIIANGSGKIELTATNAAMSITIASSASPLVQTGSGNLTLTADLLTIGAALASAGGILTLQPSSAARQMAIGASGVQFDLTDFEISRFNDGFSQIVIGQATTGDVLLTSATFRDPVKIVSGASITTVSGGSALSTAAGTNAGIELTAGGASSAISITAAVQANGVGAVNLSAATVSAYAAVASTSGGLTVKADNLTIDASATFASAGSLTIKPQTGNRPIVIGRSASDSLCLDASAISRLTDGFSSITIGGTDTYILVAGSILISAASFADPVNFIHKGAITVEPGSPITSPVLTSSGGASIALQSASSGITVGGLITSEGDLNLSVNPTNGAIVVNTAISARGNLNLTGRTLTLNADYTATAGSAIFTHSGLLTIAEGADGNISGHFTQRGTGIATGETNGVLWQGNLTATGTATFNRPTVFARTSASPSGEIVIAAGAAMTWTNLPSSYIDVYVDNAHVALSGGGAGVRVDGNFHCFAPGETLRLASSLSAVNIALYAGTLAVTGTVPTGRIIKTDKDLVLLGRDLNLKAPVHRSGFSVADDTPGDTSATATAGLFTYIHAKRGTKNGVGALGGNLASILTTTNLASLLSVIPAHGRAGSTAVAATAYDASASDLTGATVDVGKNFYLNGADLANNSGGWNLYLRTDAGNSALAFAEAYNGAVNRCTVSDGAAGLRWIAAAENVADGGGNSGWAFGRSRLLSGAVPGPSGLADPSAAIIGVCAVSDDLIRIEISGASGVKFENSNNEIRNAYLNDIITVNGGTIAVTATYTDAAASIYTTDRGDLSVFYASVANTSVVGGNRWNTDANGTSAGGADSTDRGRAAPAEPPAHRGVFPNLSIPKAETNLYFALKDDRGNRIADYGVGRGRTFTAVADRTRPALVGVTIGQAAHAVPGAANYFEYDAHNYMDMVYSEPVNIGPRADGSYTLAYTGTTRNLRGDSAWNAAIGATVPSGAPSTVSGTSAGAVGGDIPPRNESERFSLAGWFRQTSTWPPYDRGASTALTDPPNDGIEPSGKTSTAFYRLGPRTIRAYVAGWAENTGATGKGNPWRWPGWVKELSKISGDIQVPANPNIRDLSGNAVEPTNDPADARYGTGAEKAIIIIAAVGNGWDADPPAAAVVHRSSDWHDLNNEIAGRDFSNDGYIDRVEIHFLDNGSRAANWATMRGWFSGTSYPPAAGIIISGTLPDDRGGVDQYTIARSGGIRSCTLTNAAAFKFSPTGSNFTNAYNLGFADDVDFVLFDDAPINSADDPYLSVLVSDTAKWAAKDTLKIIYDEEIGRLTDLAGNLLLTTTSIAPWIITEKNAPRISLSLAAYDKSKLYIQFSEAVTITQPLPTGSAAPFAVKDVDGTAIGGFTVSGWRSLSTEATTRALELTLSQAATIELLMYGRLSPVPYPNYPDPLTGVLVDGSYIVDLSDNPMSPNEVHRLSDLGIGLVDVFMATDGIHDAGLFGTTESGALTTFDGSGSLLPDDGTIYCRLASDATATLPEPTLYFDLDPPISVRPVIDFPPSLYGKDFWLPGLLPGFNGAANAAARAAASRTANGATRTFVIPKTDSEIRTDHETQFLFSFPIPLKGAEPASTLYAARLRQPNLDSAENLLEFDLWRYGLRSLATQRGGVTILNNVIDSGKGEKAVVRVDLANAGRLIVQVFSLDGDLVRTLNRDQAAVGSYNFSWNGTNSGNQAVARGMYFIRVTATGLDEIRKVMVVKD